MRRRYINADNWKKYRGRIIAKLLGIALGAVLMALLNPLSPVDRVTPGVDISNLENNEKGILTIRDVIFIINSGGAAVDYPTFGAFALENDIEFEYYPVNNYGYDPVDVECGPNGVNCLHGQNQPIVIVDHIAEGSCAGMKSWFNNPKSYASSHFAVCRDGKVIQFIELEDASWTQGGVNAPTRYISIYGGINPNLRSISIEHEGKCSNNTDIRDFPKQRASTKLLHGWIRDTVGIPLIRATVLEHADIDGVNRDRDWNCFVGSQDAFVTSLSPAVSSDLDTLTDIVSSDLGALTEIVEKFSDSVDEFSEKVDTLIIKIEELEGESSTPTPSIISTTCDYTVISGDSLGRIAKLLYFDIDRWKELANRNNINSPYSLEVGQELDVACN